MGKNQHVIPWGHQQWAVRGEGNYLNFPKNLHSNTGTGDYFPKKVISS